VRRCAAKANHAAVEETSVSNIVRERDTRQEWISYEAGHRQKRDVMYGKNTLH